MNAHAPLIASATLRPDIAQMLASCDTADLFAILGEILEPSFGGPFCRAYPADDQYEVFVDALRPVTQIFRHAYVNIEREVRP
jgi:hypothetical protein